jgi:hypothetical protein
MRRQAGHALSSSITPSKGGSLLQFTKRADSVVPGSEAVWPWERRAKLRRSSTWSRQIDSHSRLSPNVALNLWMDLRVDEAVEAPRPLPVDRWALRKQRCIGSEYHCGKPDTRRISAIVVRRADQSSPSPRGRPLPAVKMFSAPRAPPLPRAAANGPARRGS